MNAPYTDAWSALSFRSWSWLAAPASLLGGASFMWWLWLGPYGYSLPDPWPGLHEAGPHTVFAYGTLRHPLVRTMVVGRRVPVQPAALPGYRKEALDVTPDPDAVTPGYIFEVSTEELRRLDRYERLGTRYERLLLPLEQGQAWVYRRLPLLPNL